VTARAGLAAEFGPALGVATADFNHDGWIDIYVANDGQPNQLWINQQNGTFKNAALLAGAALGAEGEAKSSMGVDAADFDNDGDEDLFITELVGQGVDLYINHDPALFEEQSARAGLRLPTLPFTGFGAAWLDVDNDGWLDLLTVNGAVTQNVDAVARREPFSLQQRKQLFRNRGNGTFEEVSDRGGPAITAAEVSRGAAFGDIDNDGDIDIVVNHKDGAPALLRNDTKSPNHWVRLELQGTRSNRDAVGARVEVVAGGRTIYRQRKGGCSMESANDPRLTVGVGTADEVAKVMVRWPSGLVSTLEHLKTDQSYKIVEPAGQKAAAIAKPRSAVASTPAR
jgi:hypothetical protein